MPKAKKSPKKAAPETATVTLTPEMSRQAKALFNACGLTADDLARCALEDWLRQLGQPVVNGEAPEMDFLVHVQARTLAHLRKGGAK